jgi:hypothetical protein
MSRSITLRRLLTLACLVAARPAAAQLPKPIPAVVFDIRGFYGGLGQDPVTAKELGDILSIVPGEKVILPASLPNRAPGGVIGLHVYPLRRKITFGLGAEAVLTQGRSVEEDAIGPTGFIYRQRLQGVSGQMSLNFGHRDGWSYLSAGMGPLAFYTYQGDLRPAEPPPFQMTINMGGGARWFAWGHVAFCFDVRFYQTEPEVPTAGYPGRQRKQLRVISAGLSLR